MNTKHTPLPWQVNQFDETQVSDCDGESRGCAPIANCDTGKVSERKANAALIVRAVNAHDDLVAALEESLNFAGLLPIHLVQKARAALAKATDDHAKA